MTDEDRAVLNAATDVLRHTAESIQQDSKCAAGLLALHVAMRI